MTSLTIEGTPLTSLGFSLKKVTGHMAAEQPKPQGSGKDDYTSVNLFLDAYYKEPVEITVHCFGRFATLAQADEALYTLYGILVMPGQRTYVHSGSGGSITFKAIMHKGCDVVAKKVGAGIFFDVKLKLLKTDD
jgi:hypothetical protein